MSYYSRFCAFCVQYDFNSSKLLWICATLCHAYIIPEQNALKTVKISQHMAKLCRKLKWLLFFLGHGIDNTTLTHHLKTMILTTAVCWSEISNNNILLSAIYMHTQKNILKVDRPSSNYSLRARPHNKTLIAKTTQLNDQDFIIRSIYKDSYWLHFKHIHHASIRALYVYWLPHLLTILCISTIVHTVAFVNLILKKMVVMVVVVVC